MWQKLPAFVRNWPILIISVLVLVPILYLTYQEGAARTSGRPTSETPSHVHGQAVSQALPEARSDATIAKSLSVLKGDQSATVSAPAVTLAPQMSHDHKDAVSVAQTGAQNSSPIPVVVAEVAAGKLVYRKCQACHSLEPGKNGLGPSLADIMDKKAASVPSYNYSPAMKGSNVTWNATTLDAYLSDPQKSIPGNKMPFPGLKTENERSALIAFLSAGRAQAAAEAAAAPAMATSPRSPNVAASAATPPTAPASSYIPGLRYTLRTGIAEGRMVYIGVGGTIDGQINPVLSAAEGQGVQVTLLNGEGAEHDIVFADQEATARSAHITGKGSSTNIAFRAGKAGDYVYFCSLPGHQLAGMEGKFLVTPQAPPQTLVEADISRLSTDLPPPIGKRAPQTLRVDLTTVELEGRLAEGATFGYWTFNGKVPGPFLRVRVGDTVDVRLKNANESGMVHSVDFHAATGPGGGAASTQTNPGEETGVKFKALIPGLYVYHCATPMVAHHIANGMYGLILVEPEEGLPPVDREFYVMQGEIYTEAAFGQHGSQDFNVEKLLAERPEYFVFNGSVGALSKLHPLHARVGETVRIFFGVGGPNFISSFHVIGEMFDRVYNLGGVLSEPLKGIQTVVVPPGGAVITEFKLDYPGNYVLVDHALSRAERGLVGILQVEGAANPEIYDGKIVPGGGH